MLVGVVIDDTAFFNDRLKAWETGHTELWAANPP